MCCFSTHFVHPTEVRLKCVYRKEADEKAGATQEIIDPNKPDDTHRSGRAEVDTSDKNLRSRQTDVSGPHKFGSS